jgi:enoyl-CoA hydratase/carnithine racemase
MGAREETRVVSGLKDILVERPEPGILVLTIANPPVNALSVTVMRGIAQALDDAGSDGTRAAVIRGDGGNFSAGGDLKSTASVTETLELLAAMMTAIRRASFPVIAAVDGHCFGGGFELAIQCDLRIAADTALFACSGVKVGWLSPSPRLADLVGLARAEELLLLGRRATAGEMERIGLISEVCAPDVLHGRAMELATEIASLAPLSVAATKAGLRSWSGRAADEADRWFQRTAAELAASKDHAEAKRALVEKRPPKFTGR